MKLKQLEAFFKGHVLAKNGYKLKRSDSRHGRCVILVDEKDQHLTSPMSYDRMDAFLDGYNFFLNHSNILHPDDEDIIKIKSFPIYSYPKAKEHLREYVLPNYHDEELEEDLWSCDIWIEGDIPEETKAELKAIREICEKSDCSYFRFIEN